MNESHSHEQLGILADHSYLSGHRTLQDTRSQNLSNISLSSLGNESIGSHNRIKKPIPCVYFLQGSCRNGDMCRFIHSGQVSPTNDDPQPATVNSASPRNMSRVSR
jgi:Zinc finger domain